MAKAKKAKKSRTSKTKSKKAVRRASPKKVSRKTVKAKSKKQSRKSKKSAAPKKIKIVGYRDKKVVEAVGSMRKVKPMLNSLRPKFLALLKATKAVNKTEGSKSSMRRMEKAVAEFGQVMVAVDDAAGDAAYSMKWA